MTERELERRAQRRLAVLRHDEEVSGNVAARTSWSTSAQVSHYKVMPIWAQL
jgi:hypothetical protein